MDAIASSIESGETGATFGDGSCAFAGSEPFCRRMQHRLRGIRDFIPAISGRGFLMQGSPELIAADVSH
jgi:hypothetical protein